MAPAGRNAPAPRIVLLKGVAGSGKTTIGLLLLEGMPAVALVHLTGEPSLLRSRLQAGEGHAGPHTG